jgi:hypothetical protein
MARYIREVRDFNGTLLSTEEASQPFPRLSEGGEWYQPGNGRLVVRHVRQVQSSGEDGPIVQTIVTVGPPFVIPRTGGVGPGPLRLAGPRRRVWT